MQMCFNKFILPRKPCCNTRFLWHRNWHLWLAMNDILQTQWTRKQPCTTAFWMVVDGFQGSILKIGNLKSEILLNVITGLCKLLVSCWHENFVLLLKRCIAFEFLKNFNGACHAFDFRQHQFCNLQHVKHTYDLLVKILQFPQA